MSPCKLWKIFEERFTNYKPPLSDMKTNYNPFDTTLEYVGQYEGKDLYSSELVPPGTMYFMDFDNFYIDYPIRKDGCLDMRYRINKTKVMLEQYL